MRFSIITCTYNSDQYLQKNIESVENQTCQDFEHIFIDGFSSDDTVEIIKRYQKEFPGKVKLFQFEPKGISNAMNRGIEKASGEYIIHLHSDDKFYDKEVLADVDNFLATKNNPNWIYGKIDVAEDGGGSIGIFPEKRMFQIKKGWLKNYLLKFINFIPHQAVFIKKETLERFGGFDETLKTHMDFDLWLKLRGHTEWCFFDKIISRYKIRPDAQSSGKNNSQENSSELKKVQKKYMNRAESLLANVINPLIAKINKTLR